MKTDLPLKRVTHLCAADLLPLIGEQQAQVLGVKTLELPASTTRLDTVLRLQRPPHPPYLHVMEWQGWPNPLILWRTMGYAAWLGQHYVERPILVTVIYLTPEDDYGEQLQVPHADGRGWHVHIPALRLWEQDAQAAVDSGMPGLMTLAPLMQGATDVLVAEAATALIRHTQPPLQAELLTALGIFAEPIIHTEQFIRLVTKERLMSSDLLTVLMQDKVQEYAAREAMLYQNLQQMVEETVMIRFPQAPARLILLLRSIPDLAQLRAVHRAILQANDLTSVIPMIEHAAQDA